MSSGEDVFQAGENVFLEETGASPGDRFPHGAKPTDGAHRHP